MDTSIKNYGYMKTLTNKNYVNEIKWDIDYDGELSNIKMAINDNGNIEAINMTIDRDTIMDMLSTPSIHGSLDKRLLHDFEPTALTGIFKKKRTRRHRRHRRHSRKRHHRHH